MDWATVMYVSHWFVTSLDLGILVFAVLFFIYFLELKVLILEERLEFGRKRISPNNRVTSSRKQAAVVI